MTTHEILTNLALFSNEARRADAAVLLLSESGLTSGVSRTWVSQPTILKKRPLWLYLTIILRGRAGYRMIDNQRGA